VTRDTGMIMGVILIFVGIAILKSGNQHVERAVRNQEFLLTPRPMSDKFEVMGPGCLFTVGGLAFIVVGLIVTVSSCTS
jgi:hypothetical protein